MVTIGVYGFDGESFLQRLRHADVACHRSLIAQRLAERHRVTIKHLRP